MEKLVEPETVNLRRGAIFRACQPSLPRGESSGGSVASHSQRRFRHRSEVARERDTFRHLQPWIDTFKPRRLHRNPFNPTNPQTVDVPEQCPDTALTAFAQLCTFRLNARRCIVSLLSTETEYILADISTATSLQYNDNSFINEQYKAWLGTSSFPRADGLNNRLVSEWQKARHLREVSQDQDLYYTERVGPHWAIFSDTRRRTELQNLTLVKQGGWIRFCASVPLRGAQGSVIGSLMVLDDKPRYGVSVPELAFLEDASDTIVQHLDSTLVRCQRQRSELMIKSLGLFNSGKSSLRDWWLSQDDVQILNAGRYTVKENAGDQQMRLESEFGPGSLVDDANETDQGDAQQYSSHLSNSGGVPSRQAPPVRPSLRPHQPGAGGGSSFDLTSALSDAYSRSSNLIREAIGADGVAILDTGLISGDLHRKTPQVSSPSPSYDNSSGSNSLPDLPSSDLEISDSADEDYKSCEVQGISTRTTNSVKGSTADAQSFSVSAKHLRRLINRHPDGFVFHFDSKGRSYYSSDEGSEPSSNEEADVKRAMRIKDARAISRATGNARSVAMLPLWDDANERWRSCMFLWIASPLRPLDKEEHLTFLTVFGHSLSADINRIESMASDKAKGTFISTMSHELRSPLHGIMAGVEFLQESQLDAFQGEMTQTIYAAASMLLDTINHILDFSKISSHARIRKSQDLIASQSTSSAVKSGWVDQTAAIDICRITEQVVETTVNAHRAQFRTLSHLPTHGTSYTGDAVMSAKGISSASRDSTVSDVSITLNIDYRQNWHALIEPGGWTRILTNLLGNALKYTYSGTITVRLTAGKPHGNHSQAVPLQLVVEDTGIGMSESFQKHGVFAPFKQEDPHSMGTGLGLSIVSQIAKKMGAHVEIRSQQGSGTKVVVRLDAQFATPADLTSLATTSHIRPTSLTVGQFHILCPEKDVSGGLAGTDHVGSSVLELASSWLECRTAQGPSISSHTGNAVCAITAERLSTLQEESPALLSQILNGAAEQHSHILVLGSSIRLAALRWDNSYTISPVFVHQPIGPKKLLQAISSDHDSSLNAHDISSPTILTAVNDLSDASRARLGATRRSTTDVETIDPGLGITLRRSLTRVADRKVLASRPRGPSPSSASSSDTATTTLSTTFVTSPPATVWSASVPADEGEETDAVLLVEDNEVNMKLLVALMKRLQTPYCCASNGREAYDLVRSSAEGRFFLVLMDISMPIMDGFEATSKIRRYEERKKRRRKSLIVALTGATSEDSRRKAFACGIDEFYSKPVKMAELRELLGRAKAAEEG